MRLLRINKLINIWKKRKVEESLLLTDEEPMERVMKQLDKPHCDTCNIQVGDRVSRQVYLDDGTWQRKGDKCLKKSPLKYGTVMAFVLKKSSFGGIDDLLSVMWDGENREKRYFHHGVDLIKEN